MKNLKIALISSEVFPFAKTGGLADVAGALPKYLARREQDVIVVMPKYRTIDEKSFGLTDTGLEITVKMVKETSQHRLFVSEHIPGVKTYFIEAPEYFDREQLYGTPNGDYPDNAARFGFFAKSVLETLEALDFEADIVHCNDWQTGLVPVFLKERSENGGFLSNAKTLFTIHNIAYQGLFEGEVLPKLGLPWKYFVMEGLEFWGKVSFMKGGIIFSDAVSTVSRKYSEEIQTAEFGYGLETILASRRNVLHGIPNGIDPEEWDPEIDGDIAARYSASKPGPKATCKRALANENGLVYSADVPIIGMITRLAAQKGLDILSQCIEDVVDLGVNLVILGAGDDEYHQLLIELKDELSGRIGVNIGFDSAMAKRIYAGSDMFLMPSRYEPCGLGQLISMRYGTIPIVRKTGGLSDTVAEFDPRTAQGTGFVFSEYTAGALTETAKRALNLYKDKTRWKKLVKNAMSYDSSWDRSSGEYVELYQKILSR
ncbi:MAG: glycogen synthase GlgA [Candidatus Coatesbacteria bacterium]|nr:glycogen synthase GlgA [Candidatus Coatesbacteria bacterium]